MRKILSKKFFDRPALKVAKHLLGKFLVRKIGKNTFAIEISEVEAYDGPRDKASHASRGPAWPAGRLTSHNAPMFGAAGNFYIYFTYGMHWMLNIVTGPKGYPAAVLIRGGIITDKNGEPRPFRGQDPRNGRAATLIRGGRLRVKSGKWIEVNGPARLTKYLKIDKKLNDLPAMKRTGLWFEDWGVEIKKSQIVESPRVGVDYAGRWAKKPYNFKIKK